MAERFAGLATRIEQLGGVDGGLEAAARRCRVAADAWLGSGTVRRIASA